ncbi:nucleoprotein TPR-like isoform X2 [Clavelina lepadiformis]|uniref:nucleoprotein TPR-like isoform X2 n=1 Tax=Clavelina lepadiformis TaxID=159417 RepID=UPI00404228EE
MASTRLLLAISQEDIDGLSKDVEGKLENYLQARETTISSLEGDIQKIKADYEQKCYELDKKFIESASRLDSESSNNEKITARCKELESELQELIAKQETTEKSLHESQQENVAFQRVKDSWNEDKLSLQHLLEKRELEIARLNDEWKSMSERLSEMTAQKNELQLKLDEISSSEVTSHYHVKRIEQEKELLTQQNTQLSEELNQKTNELVAVRKQKGNELISLRGQFELNCNENKQLIETISNLKKSDAAQQDKINELHKKLSKATEDFHSREELYRNELQSQTRLADLYKASAEDSEKKCTELISAVEELQTVVKTNCDNNDALQQQLTKAEAKVAEHYTESERLKKELESANDLLAAHRGQELSQEQLAEMCPTAALTSKFIKSGMTLTQIYVQHIEQSDELVVVKEENRRLNEAMDSILEELNAKAPLLKRQREDYERALITISQLTKQTDEASMEFQQLRQEADDAVRRSAHLNNDNVKLRKEANDLSKQVCFLLKEIEETRGRQIIMSPQKHGDSSLLVVNEDGSCNDVSSTSELISQTLVTFKDIAELQEQNQKLLGVIRELSEDRENAEQEGVDEKTRVLQTELESARDELERLREDRGRQMTMVEAVVRQRDMYRVLLAQNPEGGVPPSVIASPALLSDQSLMNTSQLTTSSSPATPKGRFISRTADITSVEQTKKAIAQLQEEYTGYKNEVLENNKILDDKMEELRTQLSQSRASCAKLEAQLEFSKERYDMMKQNADNGKKECEALRAKSNQLYNIIQQSERNVSNMNAELSATKELCSKLQARLEMSKSELEISKRSEERLVAENTSLQREQRSQTVLLSNLQSMQQSMEKQAFEVKSQLHTRVEAQEREISSLRQSNHSLTQSKLEALQGVEKQLYAVQKLHEAEQGRASKLNEELESLRRQNDALEHERDENMAKLVAVEERLARVAGGQVLAAETVSPASDVNTIRSLRQEIRDKSAEITSLESRLEKAKKNIEHLKEVSLAAEESLKQNNESNKELLDTLQTRLLKSNNRQVTLEQQLAQTEEENHALKNDKYKVTGEVEKQTADLRKQLSILQAELEASSRRMSEAVLNEQIAREDLKHQMAKADEASDNYQREMILHASAMQQLIQLKEKAKSFDADLEKVTSQSRSAEDSLKEKSEGWNEIEEKLKLENQQQKQRVMDIEEQNKLLHENIEKLSNQLLDVQSKQAAISTQSPMKLFHSRDPVAAATSAAEGSEDKSTQQLLDVIKFLRREKEISDTKCELVQSEATRLRQQIQQLEKQMTDTQENLKQEQIKVQENCVKLAKLASLEREIEVLQSVKELNKGLREERDKLDADLRSSNSRISQLQDDVAPLQAKNREMSAQCMTLMSEKKALNEEVDRWKERVQQMTQSPRRQDPEEYRRLLVEKAALAKQIESLSKELSEQKQECSSLKGQIRNLDASLQSQKVATAKHEKESSAKHEEIGKLKKDVEEKIQTINRIRRVGRRFKTQYEELLAKQKEIESKEQAAKAQEESQAGGEPSTTEATSDSRKEMEAKAMEERARLQALNQELTRSSEENGTLKAKCEELTKQLQESNENQNKLNEEILVLQTQCEEKSKTVLETKKQLEEMSEKEKKFSKLLTLAKQQIEKLRKENTESSKERRRLQEELKKIDMERKNEAEGKAEHQAKIEDLQRKLNESRAANPSASGQSTEPRKAANIRPMPSQKVNQVPPMRIQPFARVLPEPQQEMPDTERPVSQVASSSIQAAVATSVPAVQSSNQPPATAFVYPMSPANQQQQHVVSSGSQAAAHLQSAQVQQEEDSTRPASDRVPGSEVTDSDNAIVSSSDDQNLQDEARAASSSVVVSAANTVEPEAPSSSAARFVASSSSTNASAAPLNPNARGFLPGQKRTHDQTEEAVAIAPSRSVPGNSREREAQSSQATVAPLAKRQRGSPDQSSESIPVIAPSTAAQPETSSQPAVGEGLSSQVYDQKRLRFGKIKISRCTVGNKVSRSAKTVQAMEPDTESRKLSAFQSEVISVSSRTTLSVVDDEEDTSSESEYSASPPRSPTSVILISDTDVDAQSVSSMIRQPDQSQLSATSQSIRQVDVQPMPPAENEEFEEASEVSHDIQMYQGDDQMQQEVATSSIEEQAPGEIIVLSSDSSGEDEDEDLMPDQVEEEEEEEEESDENIEEEDIEEGNDAIESTSHLEIHPGQQSQQQNHPSNNLPFLVLPQEPLPPRPRLASRPGPLTPGIVPSSTDEGDGIVPCTPTLPIHRHDDSYQSISSPRIPAGGPPIRFRFEDVAAPQASLEAVPGGVGSVDNTLMDLTGAAGEETSRSVPSIPSSSSAAFTVPSVISDISDLQSSNSGNAAVSSSIQEGEGEAETDELEQAIPTTVEVSEAEATTEHRSEVREASSIPINTLRGRRRIRVKGAPRSARGRGANSPSTSNQP